MQKFQHGKVAVLNGTEPKLSLLSRAQIVRIVKCCTFILLAGCLNLYATGFPQNRITLSASNAPLAKVFKEIQKQTGFHFLYISQQLDDAKPVTIKVKDASLQEVLEACFKEQPFGYEIKENTIIIKQKPREQKTTIIDKAPGDGDPTDISGRVTDDQGTPLVGANVKVKGTQTGTYTDNNGRFVLHNVEADAVLEISFVGHEMQTVTVKGKSLLAIVLSRKQSILDETQVIAYGTTTRRFSTGNIGTVKAADIEMQPVQNLLLALEGRVPGIEIKQLTGMPGGGVTVRIQGQNSISKDLNPLIVVDGVPYPAQFMSVWPTAETIIQGGSPLNFINPADIESIDILKDADATAIYGSRAANGAILITTKKGKIGKAKLSVNLQQGWGKVTRKADMMNTRQYLDMRYEALKNDGISLASLTQSSSSYDLTLWDTTRYTDWQKTLIGGTAKYTNVNASISGGTATMQYLIGGTFNRQTAVFPGDFDDKRGGVNVNVSGASSNQKFKIQLSASYMLDKNHLPGVDLTNSAIVLAPNAPASYDDDGTLNWALNAAGSSTWTNPLRYTASSDFDYTTKNLLTNLNLAYNVLPGLNIRISSGYTGLHSNMYNPRRLEYNAPELRANSVRRASYGTRDMDSWIIEPQVDYKKKISKGNIEALVGSTIQQSTSDLLYLEGSGYANDLLLKSSSAATTVTVDQSTSFVYKYNALYGRVNYNWNEKYILNLTARRDGSSRFGEANKFHNFWGVGAGWIFSQEKWMLNNLSFVSFGKFRGSYGTTGNDGIGDYSYLGLYSTSNGSIPYQGSAGLSLYSLPNPHLEWEETRKLQGGIDLGFLNDRIIINATYARNRSSNQLTSYRVPSITGMTGVMQNMPATIQNTSWEFAVTTTAIKTRQLKWTISTNVTLPRNKLVSFPNIELTPYKDPTNGVIIGKPLGTLVVYPYGGVDVTTGKYLLIDSNGNATTGAGAVKNVFLNTLSKFYGGFQNSVSYKGFQLDFLFQFVWQKGPQQLYYYNGSNNPGRFSSDFSNQPVTVLDRWQKPGDVAVVSAFTTKSISIIPAVTNVWYNYNASYIRLKNLSLSWQLPANWLSRMHLQNARLYFQGQNLATITKFTGLDPESQSITSLPPLQMWTVGAHIDF